MSLPSSGLFRKLQFCAANRESRSGRAPGQRCRTVGEAHARSLVGERGPSESFLCWDSFLSTLSTPACAVPSYDAMTSPEPEKIAHNQPLTVDPDNGTIPSGVATS